jgi:hypothetical protein
MGTTTKGYPYPEPIDPIAQGADAIEALASAVDTNLGRAFGAGITVNVPSTTTVSAVVTFPVGRFTANPHVAVTGQTNAPGLTFVSHAGATTTGVTVYIARTGGFGNVSMNVVAVQAP